MTKPADSKQTIPSPEDRVRAIREKLENVKSGRWHKTLWTESALEDVAYLLSLVEELKGQVVSASPQPTCPKCGSEVTWWITAKDQMPVVRCRSEQCDEIFRIKELSDFAQFFAALLTKRKDYHAEYVEAVEAVEKARLRLVALEGAGNKLNAAALIMRCCADLKEAPDKEECQLMGDALRSWERALTPEPATKAEVQK